MTDLMHKAEIQQMVRAAYLAIDAARGAGAVYYDPDELAELPPGAVAWSLGVGNPLAHAALPPGAHVLDVGCGAGIDVLLAARPGRTDGRVIGLDLLPEMCERARAHAREAGLTNVEIVEGEMEAIPLPDDAVDAIISNGVINLSARKMRALFECARVLRPGGHLCLTDVTLDERDLPPEVLRTRRPGRAALAGAMAERALLRALGRVGPGRRRGPRTPPVRGGRTAPGSRCSRPNCWPSCARRSRPNVSRRSRRASRSPHANPSRTRRAAKLLHPPPCATRPSPRPS